LQKAVRPQNRTTDWHSNGIILSIYDCL
jgi:casein kinase 1